MVYLSESKEEAYWGFGKQSCSRALSSSHLCFVVRPAVSGVLFFLYFFNPNYWERKFDWSILTQGWSSSEPINSSQGSMTAKHNFSEKILVGKYMVSKDKALYRHLSTVLSMTLWAIAHLLCLCILMEADPWSRGFWVVAMSLFFFLQRVDILGNLIAKSFIAGVNSTLYLLVQNKGQKIFLMFNFASSLVLHDSEAALRLSKITGSILYS